MEHVVVAHKLARYVTRQGDAFVLGGKSAYAKHPEGICSMCALRLSCVDVGRSDDPVSSCEDIVMPVGFEDKIGTDKNLFNTVRLGHNTAEKFREGDPIALVDRKGLVYGAGVVKQSIKATKTEMLSVHAHMNHTQLHMDKADAPKRLWGIVAKIYHNFMKTDEPVFSVLYIERDDSVISRNRTLN